MWRTVTSRRNVVYNKGKGSLLSKVLLPLGKYQVWLIKEEK